MEDELVGIVDELVNAEGIGGTSDDESPQVLVHSDVIEGIFAGFNDLLLDVLGPIVPIDVDGASKA